MPDFYKYLRDLFCSSREQHKPFVHETISRSEKELAAYERWKNSEARQQLLQYVGESYARRNDPGRMEALDFAYLESAAACGFIHYIGETRFEPSDFQHFFDYLKELILPLGYAAYVSDAKTFVRDRYVERKERHYLKPRPARNVKIWKAEQLFGNITLELIRHDDRAVQLKLLCNVYDDYNYHPPRSFDELMQALFGPGA